MTVSCPDADGKADGNRGAGESRLLIAFIVVLTCLSLCSGYGLWPNSCHDPSPPGAYEEYLEFIGNEEPRWPTTISRSPQEPQSSAASQALSNTSQPPTGEASTNSSGPSLRSTRAKDLALRVAEKVGGAGVPFVDDPARFYNDHLSTLSQPKYRRTQFLIASLLAKGGAEADAGPLLTPLGFSTSAAVRTVRKWSRQATDRDMWQAHEGIAAFAMALAHCTQHAWLGVFNLKPEDTPLVCEECLPAVEVVRSHVELEYVYDRRVRSCAEKLLSSDRSSMRAEMEEIAAAFKTAVVCMLREKGEERLEVYEQLNGLTSQQLLESFLEDLGGAYLQEARELLGTRE